MENEMDLSLIALKGLRLLRKYLLLLIISVVLCIGLSLARFYTKTPEYQSSMLVSTGFIDSSIAIGLVEELQDLIDDQNDAFLTEKLHLKEGITKLKTIEVEKEEGKADNGKAGIIEIIVITTETSILPSLEKSIVKYLEETPYVKKRVGIENVRLNEGIRFLSRELDEISTLKTNISKIAETGSVTNASFDLEDIYRQSRELFERKLDLTDKLKMIENFQVIQGFTAFQKPVSPKLSLSLAGGFAAGLIFAFLIIFFKELRRHLKTLEEESA